MKLTERFKGLFASQTEAAPPPPADAVKTLKFNPLELAPGRRLKIDNIDFRSFEFEVTEITQAIASEKMWCTYKLVDKVKPGEKQEKEHTVYLRAFRDRGSFRLIGLQLHERTTKDSGIQGALDDIGGHFVIDVNNDGKIIENYFRLEEQRKPLRTVFQTLADRDGDGQVTAAEVKTSEVFVYDYSRLTQIDGVQTTQFLFVEDERTGPTPFAVYRGYEIAPSAIDLL